jgi:inosine/xanthosine triphosphatase
MTQGKQIVVGSLNPVKIQAALAGFTQMFPDQEFEAQGFSVPSGVSAQPMTCAETLQGASNRATELKRLVADADFSVGIEGGIEVIDETYFASAWVVIIDGAGKLARGRSGSFALPPRIKQLVETGLELGQANDEVFGEFNSKQSGGAVGSLTAGVITRQLLYEHAMALALIGVRQPELFD